MLSRNIRKHITLDLKREPRVPADKGIEYKGDKRMKMTRLSQLRQRVSLILCMLLIAAMALITTGCNDQTSQETSTNADVSAEATVLGEGKTQFTFTVTDKEGTKTSFEVHTDKEMVGEALLECGLIEGDEGQYGLYVKKVNGILADFNTDGTYWAFYVNGEYAVTGVDVTPITAGETYSFKVEK